MAQEKSPNGNLDGPGNRRIYDYRSDVHDIYHGICSKDHPSVNRQDRPRDAGFS